MTSLFLPLSRFIDLDNHLELLSGRITFDRQRASHLIQTYLTRGGCGPQGCSPQGIAEKIQALSAGAKSELTQKLAGEFLTKAISQELEPEDMLRVTTTSFMDAYNFDVRQLMKSCVHHVLPSGHLIPFSAYNVLYRDGHLPLPELRATQGREPVGRSSRLVSISAK